MTLAELNKMLERAREWELKARVLNDTPKRDVMQCGLEYGSVDCHSCRHFEFCEADNIVREQSIHDMLTIAIEGYREVERLIRESLTDASSIDYYELLASVLTDIAIHPFTADFKHCSELWESYYHWLSLYFKTKQEKYLEKSNQCEAFRNAVAVKIKS